MKISENKIWFILFLSLFFFYYVTYYLPRNLNQLCGDGICQIAYWRSLFEPALRGSTGAAVTKPGWTIILGLCHEFYSIFNHSHLLLKLVLVFFITFFIWIITRISVDIGGPLAAIICLPYAITSRVFFDWYQGGGSELFFIPLMMCGIWLYSKRRERAGILLLIISILFRIEAGFVILLICFREFLKGNYKRSLLIGISVVITVLIWLTFVYIVQGDFRRLDSGVGVGYNFTYKERYFLNIYNSLRAYAGGWKFYFYSLKYDIILPIFLVLGMIFIKEIRIYAVAGGLFIGHILNVILFAGVPGYMEISTPFSMAIGIGSFCYFLEKIKNKIIQKKFRIYFAVSTYIFVIGFMIQQGMFDRFKAFYINIRKDTANEVVNPPYIINALDIVNRNLIPKGSSVLTEDDVIYSLVVNSPRHYFGKCFAFPYFNICDSAEQERILKDIDFIYISKLSHSTFFLIEDWGLVRWKNDAFRGNIMHLLRNGGSFSMYGITFRLLEESEYGFLIKAENKDN